MASGDYISCEVCGSKGIYDGDRCIRDQEDLQVSVLCSHCANTHFLKAVASSTKTPSPDSQMRGSRLTYDEVEEIILRTEPPGFSDRDDQIWTRRMAVALADLFNARLPDPQMAGPKDDESLWRFWNEKARSQALEIDRLRAIALDMQKGYIAARDLVERAQAIISTSTYPNWHEAARAALSAREGSE